MNELIERLETMTTPGRDADFMIFEAAAFPAEYFGSKIQSWSRAGGAGYTVNTEDGIRHLSAFNAPNYTGSIDAALTLLPKGWFWELSTAEYEFGVPHATLWAPTPGRHRAIGSPATEAGADTPAFALCLAALKARALQPA